MIKRVSMWQLKEVGKSDNLVKMKKALLSLSSKFSFVSEPEVGLNISKSASAYDIIFIAYFRNLEELAEFESNQYHKAVGVFVSDISENRVVVDYE